MPGQNQIPAWPFSPDWANGISETLEWKTVVLTSPTGAEQRYANRLTPRRTLDIPYLVSGAERSYLDTLMMQNGGKEWYAPIPHERISYRPIVAGTNVFFFPAFYGEFRAGGHVLIQGRRAFEWDVCRVNNVNADGIGTDEGVTLDYPEGCTITPVLLARITDKMTAQRHTSRVLTGTMRFMSMEPSIWPPVPRQINEVPTYNGYLLMTQQPNSIETLDYDWVRMMVNTDNDVAIPTYTDTALRAFTSQKYTWFLHGQQARSNFRDFLYQLAGRREPVWVPTFNDDYSLGRGIINPYGRIQTRQAGDEVAIGFYAHGETGPYPIGLDIIDFSIPPDSGLQDVATGVTRMSSLRLKRLDQDSIEIMHHSDKDGMATVTALFRDAPDIRIPFGYNPLAFPNALKYPASGPGVPASNEPSELTTNYTVSTGVTG